MPNCSNDETTLPPARDLATADNPDMLTSRLTPGWATDPGRDRFR